MFDSDFEIFGFSVLVSILGINAATLCLVKKFINSTQTVQESKNTNINTQVIVEEPSHNVTSSLQSTQEFLSSSTPEFSTPHGLLSLSSKSLRDSHNSKLGASQNSKLGDSQKYKLGESHASGLTQSALIEEKILQRV